MKNLFFLLTLMASTWFVTGQTFSGIIQNPDFEDSSGVAPWNSGSGSAAISINTDMGNVQNGTQSLQFENQGNNGVHFINSTYEASNPSGVAGDELIMTAWIKTNQDATFFIRSRTKFVNAGANTFVDDRREFTFLANVWQQLTFSHTATGIYDTAAYFIQPQIANNDAGLILHIDNLTNIQNTLSTNDVEKISFSMYPNPVKDEFLINSNSAFIKKIEAFDLLGKSIFIANNVEDAINVSSLDKGIYLVRVTTENGSSTKKFMKE